MKTVQAILLIALFVCLHVPAESSPSPDSGITQLKERIAYRSFRLALEQLVTGDTATTQSLLEQTVASAPECISARFVLGFIYERTGALAKAWEQYREILRLQPGERFAAIALEESKSAPLAPTPNGGSASPQPLSEFEQQLVNLVNIERKAKKLKPLGVDLVAAAIAREHSEEMRDRNYFSHESPTPGLRLPLNRYMKRVGKPPRTLAENIARRWSNHEYSLNAANIVTAHQELMESPHHRENILLPEVTRVGVGIAVNERGDFWITELFVKPK